MAEDQDRSQKTEDATQRRIDEARAKGQVAVSREVNHWFVILAVAIVLFMAGPQAARGISASLVRFLEAPHLLDLSGPGLPALMWRISADIVIVLAPIFVILILAALGAGLVQNGFIFAPDSIQPTWEKISPMAGMKRLFSARAMTEFVKGLIKIAVVGTAATFVVLPELSAIERLTAIEPIAILQVTDALVIRVVMAVLACMTVIAALDFMYQRFEHLRNLRMTKQELKDDTKQSEGDPMIKSRLRQLRVERARRRMMSAVPKADVVITNPTHFAVALKYDADKMGAPKLVAKGTDLIAQRIRALAEENHVPIVENPPLARALHGTVEVGEEVPPEHYRAVAEVIGYVMRLKPRQPPAPAP